MTDGHTIANNLGMSIGASRAAITNGWFDISQQIGVSGHSLSSRVVVVAGASGTGAFRYGLKNAQFVVAINNDPYAEIFRYADVGIVGDLYDILPKLRDKIQSE
ncbi:FAD-binding protein [Vibrio metschnikovii]|uniref:FAD-binding protein n=1 Tax=Vibrio metschnikovii TaxID=28172 RepID=UPI001C311781|nr:FAD-binding protein [Vibrio metschnikovii]